MPQHSNEQRHNAPAGSTTDTPEPGRSMSPPEFSLDNSSERTSESRGFRGLFAGNNTEEDIPASHINYEYIAHHLAYQGADYIKNDAKAQEILDKMGYRSDNYGFKKGPKGFQALLLHPKAEGGTPVLALRGTADAGGFSTDLDLRAVGRSQFRKNREAIEECLNIAGGKVVVTGHSLGGAMAQHVAANFTGQISDVVTFQSPGVDLITKDKYKENLAGMDESEHPDVTHHIANNDFVDKAGDFNLAGDYYKHRLKSFIGPVSAHTSYLFGTDQFEEQRAEVGLDKDTFKEHIGKEVLDQDPSRRNVRHHEHYPHPLGRLGSEVLRRGAGILTSPFRFFIDQEKKEKGLTDSDSDMALQPEEEHDSPR